MSLSSLLLAPLALLLPVADVADSPAQPRDYALEADGAGGAVIWPAQTAPTSGGDRSDTRAIWPFAQLMHGFSGMPANQVRIEQRMTIRITPAPAPVQRSMLMDLPSREIGPRFIERRFGKCLPVSRISGVQAQGGSRLILYLRDQRIISAELERACRARDFYSGFYLARSSDGMLCVERDTLLSRNGANCKLTQFRQLVEMDD